MSKDIKLRKARISKIIQSGGSFSSWLGKKALKSIPIPLARYNLPRLLNNLTLNIINKFGRKISAKGVVRPEKGFTLFILNKAANHIIKIIKSLETGSKTLNRKTRRRLSWSFVSTFSCFISTTNDFFSSKRYKWNRSKKSRKRIYE